MNYFQPHYTIVGFTADASAWCYDCGMTQYPHLATDDHARDHEGNEVHPVFAGDEWDYRPSCDSCGDQLDVVVIPDWH